MVLSDTTNILIYIWKKVLDLLLNKMKIAEGVSIGWIILGVFLIGVMIATVLSRPISNSIEWRQRDDRDK